MVVLAVQNMEATSSISKEQDIEWSALGGSLSMMSKGMSGIRVSLNPFNFGQF